MSENAADCSKKILVAYAGKTGTCAICADILKKRLQPLEADICDLCADGLPMSEQLREYGAIVVGSSVRYGRLNKLARELYTYLDEMQSDLIVGGFICCCYADRMREYITKIPKFVLHGELGVSCFGGDLNLDRTRGFDRIVVRVVRDNILHGGENGDGLPGINLPTINEVNIAQFSTKLFCMMNKKNTYDIC